MLSSPSLMALSDIFVDDFQIYVFNPDLAPELWTPMSSCLFYIGLFYICIIPILKRPKSNSWFYTSTPSLTQICLSPYEQAQLSHLEDERPRRTKAFCQLPDIWVRPSQISKSPAKKPATVDACVVSGEMSWVNQANSQDYETNKSLLC